MLCLPRRTLRSWQRIGSMHYDVCRTVQELTQRLSPAVESADPIFVYTQPQNIQLSVIDCEGCSVPDEMIFPPFLNSAYAWPAQKMDSCLGVFFRSLEKNGMYHDSVIVITSDVF